MVCGHVYRELRAYHVMWTCLPFSVDMFTMVSCLSWSGFVFTMSSVNVSDEIVTCLL